LRIIRVCRINSVLIRMGRLKSPYDPSLIPTDLPFPLVLSNEGRINSFNAALNQFIQMQLSCSQLIFPSALSFQMKVESTHSMQLSINSFKCSSHAPN